jgi:hypothetical protein
MLQYEQLQRRALRNPSVTSKVNLTAPQWQRARSSLRSSKSDGIKIASTNESALEQMNFPDCLAHIQARFWPNTAPAQKHPGDGSVAKNVSPRQRSPPLAAGLRPRQTQAPSANHPL